MSYSEKALVSGSYKICKTTDRVSKRNRYANYVTNLSQNQKQKQQKVLDLLRKFK